MFAPWNSQGPQLSFLLLPLLGVMSETLIHIFKNEVSKTDSFQTDSLKRKGVGTSRKTSTLADIDGEGLCDLYWMLKALHPCPSPTQEAVKGYFHLPFTEKEISQQSSCCQMDF